MNADDQTEATADLHRPVSRMDPTVGGRLMTDHATEPTNTTGYDMSNYWRLVSNDGGLITGTWWVTRPDEKRGKQHVNPVDVTMWNEDRSCGLLLGCNDFTAFVKDGAVEPLQVRASRDYVTAEAEAREDEIKAAILAVVAAVEWSEVAL